MSIRSGYTNGYNSLSKYMGTKIWSMGKIIYTYSKSTTNAFVCAKLKSPGSVLSTQMGTEVSK